MSKEVFKQVSFFTDQDLINMAPPPRDSERMRVTEQKKEKPKVETGEEEEIVEPKPPEWLMRNGVHLQPATNGSHKGAPED